MHVSEFGALGDGVTDDTVAIQAAVNACQGELNFDPDRTYRIRGVGITLKSGVRLKNPNLTLTENLAPYTRCLRVPPGTQGVVISGGIIRGSRSVVTGLQWGKGIELDTCEDVLIDGTVLLDHYFDGIWIGGNTPATRITIRDITCERNRRQGLSITHGTTIKILGSIFGGSVGQDPQSGIDIEPNPGEGVHDVFIYDCEFIDNAGQGLYIHKGQGNPGSEITIISCRFTNNAKYQLIVNNATGVVIAKCVLRGGAKGASFGALTMNLTFCDSSIVDTPQPLIFAGVIDPKVYNNTIAHGRIDYPVTGYGAAVQGDIYISGNRTT